MLIGFEAPSHAELTPKFIENEFRRMRDEINAFFEFYKNPLEKKSFFQSKQTPILKLKSVSLLSVKKKLFAPNSVQHCSS